MTAGAPPRSPLAVLLHLSSLPDLVKIAPEVTYLALKILSYCVHPLNSLLPLPSSAQTTTTPANNNNPAPPVAAENELPVTPGGSLRPAAVPAAAVPPATVPAVTAAVSEAAGTASWIQSMEGTFKTAREVVRANGGIKIALHLLQSQNPPPGAPLLAVRSAACR